MHAPAGRAASDGPSERWETVLAAVLFLGSTYAAVWFIVERRFGAAGYALFCAYGFFHALMSFLDAADLRGRIRRMREEQRAQGQEGH